MAKLTEAQREAVEMVDDICKRADALGINLVKFPVPEVRELIAIARRSALSSATTDEPSDALIQKERE